MRKLISIISTVIPARKVMIVLARLMLINRFKARKPKSANIGISPGYIRKEASNSPLSSKITERCRPHPGQSIPNTCLLMQGNMNFSESSQIRKGNFIRGSFGSLSENYYYF